MCIYCSGVHRSLGVQYSRVRSLTLDKWEPEVLKVMIELGNQVVNTIYEARVDGNIQRATETCEDSVRTEWIKAKYVGKKFVLPIYESKSCCALIKNDTKNDTEEDVVGQENNDSRKKIRQWSVSSSNRRSKPIEVESPSETATQQNNKFERQTSFDSFYDNDSIIWENNETYDSVFIIGQKCESNPFPWSKEDFALNSDEESVYGDDDDDPTANAVDIVNLNPNLLLYKASAAHNLSVMCNALALGANKNWSNTSDLNRNALHQAVLSVCQ